MMMSCGRKVNLITTSRNPAGYIGMVKSVCVRSLHLLLFYFCLPYMYIHVHVHVTPIGNRNVLDRDII